jgi:hypothetical protein
MMMLFFCFSLQAEEKISERVYVHTDKDCYVAGEDIWVKFYLVNSDFHPSTLSKVGYIEICDSEKPHIQIKLALNNGSGAGKIKIPAHTPSGIYQLSAYTRFMRNEGEKVFFNREIVIINLNQPKTERVEFTESYEGNEIIAENSNVGIHTDLPEYEKRDKVLLSLNNLPANTADLVVSVSRNDSIASLKVNKKDWLKKESKDLSSSILWLPEYEGHIVTGRYTSKLPNSEQYTSSIGLVGNDIRYLNGKTNEDNQTVSFYAGGIYGSQEMVVSVYSPLYEKTSYRMDVVSPFQEALPDNLSILKFYPNNNHLMERYIALQLNDETTPVKKTLLADDYYNLPVSLSYDLDEYTRFNTLGETILEFIKGVRVSKKNEKRNIQIFLKDEMRYNIGNTLVLLDGIPIYNHDDILDYNPQNIKKINIYDGRYNFGDELFDGIVSFITYKRNLASFRLSDNSQLFGYEFPSLPVDFEFPDYSDETTKSSRKPDFRHTLYWNPFVKPEKDQPTQLSFYTSDLSGEFDVVVEGITLDGKIIYGKYSFNVK